MFDHGKRINWLEARANGVGDRTFPLRLPLYIEGELQQGNWYTGGVVTVEVNPREAVMALAEALGYELRAIPSARTGKYAARAVKKATRKA